MALKSENQYKHKELIKLPENQFDTTVLSTMFNISNISTCSKTVHKLLYL
jgi:hypothetical protein